MPMNKVIKRRCMDPIIIIRPKGVLSKGGGM